jgi:hypothetical protein
MGVTVAERRQHGATPSIDNIIETIAIGTCAAGAKVAYDTIVDGKPRVIDGRQHSHLRSAPSP